jgi:uncharacterized protein
VAPDGLPSVPAVLARLARFEVDSVICATAAAYPEIGLRPLNAVHLATAQIAANTAPLTPLVTFDTRLAQAARTLGITVVTPGGQGEMPVRIRRS